MKAKRGKCLALVAVLAMVVCAFAVALPAGDSDAADTETVAFNETATVIKQGNEIKSADGVYILAANTTTDSAPGAAGTVYVMAGTTLKINAADVEFKIIPIKSYASNLKSVVVYKGIELTNAGSITSYAVSSDGAITVTGAAAVSASTYGVLVTNASAATVFKYYPEGTDVGDVNLKEGGSYVLILNGSAKVNVVYEKESKPVTVQTITATDIVSNKAVRIEITAGTISAASTATGIFTVSGGNVASGNGSSAIAATSGSITVDKGNYTLDGSAKLDAVLNGFSDGTKVYKAIGTGVDVAAASVSKVYGNIGNVEEVLTNGGGVNFVNATCDVKVGYTNNYNTLTLSGATANITAKGWISAVTSGTISLTKGTLSIQSGQEVENGAALTVSAGTTLKLSGTLTLKGTMSIYGKLTSTDAGVKTLTVQGEKDKTAVLKAYSGSEITNLVNVNDTGTYTSVDISGARGVEYVAGTGKDARTYSQSQIVTLADDYELTGSSAKVTINGSLVIPEGMTMTISNGATVIVEGTLADVQILGALVIEDEGSSFTVNSADSVAVSGQVSVDEDGALTVKSDKFVVKSGAIVDSDGTFSANKMTVNAGGIVYLTGTATITDMSVAGAVVLDEATINGASTIHLTAAEASVSVIEATMAAGNTLTVDDYNSTAKAARNTVLLTATNGKLSDTDEAVTYTTISGLYLTADGKYTAATGSAEAKDTRTIDLMGAVSAENEGEIAEGTALLTIQLCGDGLTVADALSLGEDVKLTFKDVDDKLSVSGTMNATDGSIATGVAATLDVTGMVMTGSKITTGGLKVNAVYYTTLLAEAYYYTTLAAAIESEASTITVYGTVTIKESATVPADVTLDVDGTLNVGTSSDTSTRDVVLTIESGAKAKGATINVYGSLAVETAKDFKVKTVNSDVKVTDNVSAVYTNIYTALNEAEVGDTVTVTASTVTLDANITVKEGVTLEVASDKALKVASGKQIVITINGAVIAAKGIDGTFTGDKKSSLNIAGELLTAESGKTVAKDYYGYYNFAGAYYYVTGSNGTWMHITTLENAVEDAQLTTAIYVYGKVTAGDVLVTGESADDRAALIVADGASLTAGTISLDNADFNAVETASVTASFEGLNGAISVKNLGYFAVAVVDGDDGVDVLSFTGKFVTVGAEGAKSSLSVDSGSAVAMKDSTGKFTTVDITGIDSFSIASNAVLYVNEGATMTASNTAKDYALAVAGTLIVSNSGSLTADNVYVTGTLAVAAAETGKTAGKIAATGSIYVGYSGSDLGAAAELSAPANTVTASKIYVAAGATVSADAVKDLKHTAFYVAGTEKFTVYTSETVAISDIAKPKVAGANVIGWNSTKNIGDVEKVEAKIDYDVYKLSFIADYGFADIYVDGAKVASVSGGKVIYVDPYTEGTTTYDCIVLKAGSHTVEYTLKSGYSGDKVTTSFNGKEFSKTFSITTDMDWKDTTYKMVLAGVTQSEPVVPEQEKKDSTLTDALLIVLVVLIAVMAIMVALRLMRS